MSVHESAALDNGQDMSVGFLPLTYDESGPAAGVGTRWGMPPLEVTEPSGGGGGGGGRNERLW